MKTKSTTAVTPQYLRQLDYDEVEVAFENGKIIKKGLSQEVRLCQVQTKRTVIKRYKSVGFISSLRILTGLSRPHKSQRISRFLQKHEIPCPLHPLVVSNWHLCSACSFLLIEHIPGPTLRDLLSSDSTQALTEQTAEAALGTIRALHLLGLSHGDLHPGNLIVKDETTVHLIDLDNVRRTRSRQQRDVKRFLDAVKKSNQNKDLLLDRVQPLNNTKV